MRWLDQNAFQPTEFYATNPAAAFPSAQAKAALEKFAYVKPTNPIPDRKAGHTLILVERPGHYKREHGGYVAYDNGITSFLWATEYAELLRTNLALKSHILPTDGIK